MRVVATLVPVLTLGWASLLPAQDADRYVGTYVGTNIVGPVTVEVTREGDKYIVYDKSSTPGMSGEATVGENGALTGQYVTRLFGMTRRHRFTLTPDGDGFRYRTTGQNTPLERYRLLDGTAESQAWFEIIGGRQVAAFDRYSSGGSTSGGYQSEKRATLCTDGTFAFRSSSSSSISGDGISASSSSSDAGEGRWRIYTQAGASVVELRWNSGEISQHRLERRGNEIYVDGERFLRGERVC